MADKSMVEYNDYAMESTGLTGMISSGLPEIAGEKTKMKKRKPKERIYVCHTYYHVYVACLKELTLPRAMRGKGGSGAEHDVERLWQPEGACRKKRPV